MSRPYAFLVPALALVLLALLAIPVFLHEQPVGSISGVVVAQESGRPIPEASLYLAPVQAGQASHHAWTDRKGRFRFTGIAAGYWRLEGSGRAHRLDRPVAIQVAEQQRRRVTVEMPPEPPFLQSLRTTGTYRPSERPSLHVRGFGDVSRLRVTVHRVDVARLAGRWYLLSHLLWGGADSAVADMDKAGMLHAAHTFTVPVGKRDPEGVFERRIALPDLGPGAYVALAGMPGDTASIFYNVTDLALVTKSSGRRVLAYVADLGTGRAQPGVTVRVLADGAPHPTPVTTDAWGLAGLRLPGDGQECLVLATRGSSRAFLHLYSGENDGAEDLVVYPYTDRPVYRPGDTVHLKAVLRRAQAGGYRVPAGLPVTLNISDPAGNPVLTRRLVTGPFGSYATDFALHPEALTGTYAVEADLGKGQTHTSWVTVASYRKPEFTLALQPARRRVILGESNTVEVDSRYYFGAPVAHAPVEYTVYRQEYYPWYESGGEEPLSPRFGEEYEYEGYYGEIAAEGKTETGDNGRATIRVPTGLPRGARAGEYDYRYRVEAMLAASSTKSVSADTSFLATRGDIDLQVDSDPYLASPGQPVTITVTTRDYDGRPVTGIRVNLTAGTETWREGETRRSRRWAESTVTGKDGTGRVTLRPAVEGAWYLDARARDRAGRPLLARTSLWVTSGDADFSYRYSGIEVTADRKSYRVGDIARLAVNSRHPGVSALVAVEGMTLLDARVVPLPKRTTVLEVPVTPAFSPNVTVTVSYVYHGEFVTGEAPLVVDTGDRRLRLRVTPERRGYQPGETARLTVTTTDRAGEGVPAEVSLGVVDEAIYGVKADTTPSPFLYFWGRTPNRVQTAYSFSEYFLSNGDKEGAGTLRRRFPDTAYWNPALVTDASGRAQVEFTVPDTLTTWRITARGGDAASRFGESKSSMLVTRPLVARLLVPPVLRVGDRPLLAAVVHNRSRRAVEVDTRLEVSGLRLRSGRAENRLHLDPGEEGRLEWQTAVYRTGRARLRFWARGGGLADALEQRPLLLPVGREMLTYRSGSAGNATASETVRLRADAERGASSITIRLTPTLVGPLLASARYLAHYPYGCTEQTMSAFLPDIMLARVGQAGLLREILPEDLPDMVQAGLLKLASLRHDDGGWGWWDYDQSDPWMTAYVLFGLATAREAGYQLNEQWMDNAGDRLRSWLARKPPPAPELKAFLVFSLAQAGQDLGPTRPLDGLIDTHYRLSPAGLALTALAAARLGRPETGDLAAALWQRSRVDEAGDIYWPGRDSTYLTTLDAQALAAAAVIRLTPQDPRIPGVIRHLMASRTGDHWESTRQTALVIYALAPRLAAEAAAHASAQVSLNGRPIATESLAPGPEAVVRIPGRSLQPGLNEVTIAGRGPVYYALALRQRVRGGGGEVLSPSEVRLARAWFPADIRPGAEQRAQAERHGYRVGEAVRVRLTITTPTRIPFVMIEDPYPAGMEVAETGEVDPWEWGHWWSAMDVRDDRVNIAAREVPPGTHTVEYYLRAVTPGRYTVPPATVYPMYRPQQAAWSTQETMEVRP